MKIKAKRDTELNNLGKIVKIFKGEEWTIVSLNLHKDYSSIEITGSLSWAIKIDDWIIDISNAYKFQEQSAHMLEMKKTDKHIFDDSKIKLS